MVLGPQAGIGGKRCLKSYSIFSHRRNALQLYYIYDKSPQKCREMEEIITDLQQYLEFNDGRVRLVQANGSRWVTHKANAMRRVLSKFGACTDHLTFLSQDSSVRSSDQAKLRGYCQKWWSAKYPLGCAFLSISSHFVQIFFQGNVE